MDSVFHNTIFKKLKFAFEIVMDISLLILGCKSTTFFLNSKYRIQYFFNDKKFKVFSLNLELT
ncbi:MAG TPA: hypothetical protein DCQ68_20370 [Chryseobacterium indologenes]|nr:hypothetical protein [Chryseobacterium indologenes]